MKIDQSVDARQFARHRVVDCSTMDTIADVIAADEDAGTVTVRRRKGISVSPNMDTFEAIVLSGPQGWFRIIPI
jgi:hypothetical protein